LCSPSLQPWEKWYIANDEWGVDSHNIWQWMEKGYNKEMSARVATQFSGYGGYGGGGGASQPKSPKSVQSWKSKADKIIQVGYIIY